MAQKIEQWAASDGTVHPSQDAAEAYDNDLTLTTQLSKFTDSVYAADISSNTPFKRLEKDILIMAIFRNRKPLLDILLRHSAGTTLDLGPDQMVAPPLPKREHTVVRAAAGSAPAATSTPPVSNKEPNSDIGVPARPKSATGAPPEVPDNFIFNNGKVS